MYTFKFISEHVDVIAKNLDKRYSNLDLSSLKQWVEEYRSITPKIEKLKAQRNKKNDEIVQLKNQGKEVSNLFKDLKSFSNEIKLGDQKLGELKNKIMKINLEIPNLLDERVPFGRSEEDNELYKSWGERKKFSFRVQDHIELGELLEIAEYPVAAHISGSRFSYFKGKGAILIRAITQFFLNENTKRGYEEHNIPYLVRKKTLETTGQLPKFKKDLFKIENEDMYLIPTAEVPLTSFLCNKVTSYKDLPKRIMGYSSCFRAEAGAAGKEVKGTFRNHQFEKVELVSFSEPEKSDMEHEYMLETVERLFQLLKIPYQIKKLCSGDISFSAKFCYDIEAWIPSMSAYREVSSVSNFGIFQSVRGGMRYKDANNKNNYLHTLNGSALAVGRAYIAILENYQEEDGSVTIPNVLRDYTGFDKITLPTF